MSFSAPVLAPLRVRMDRVTHITVCLRPFRAAGPRLDVETIGDKRVVHNYGHGGSGWSLSWGSAQMAAAPALEGGATDIAVIGCGALGLTAALTLRRAGARVTIYASERAPGTRSARASGQWSPDSRIADAARVDPGFPALWERMARVSYAAHHSYVGLPGAPVSWQDRYSLFDTAEPTPERPSRSGEIDFAEYGSRLHDLVPRFHTLTPGTHPFPVPRVRHGVSMQFNVAELSDRLTRDFLTEGGRIETRTFNTPSEFSDLTEPVIVNCTGYGAKALFGDDTMTPVRGQIAWLAPQPEVDYGVFYDGVSVVSRPDGIVVQKTGESDMFGYGIDDETPDRAEAEAAVAKIADLYARAGFTPT